MTIKRFALPLVLLAASSVMVWAGCLSDCKDNYDSEVDLVNRNTTIRMRQTIYSNVFKTQKTNISPASRNALASTSRRSASILRHVAFQLVLVIAICGDRSPVKPLSRSPHLNTLSGSLSHRPPGPDNGSCYPLPIPCRCS